MSVYIVYMYILSCASVLNVYVVSVTMLGCTYSVSMAFVGYSFPLIPPMFNVHQVSGSASRPICLEVIKYTNVHKNRPHAVTHTLYMYSINVIISGSPNSLLGWRTCNARLFNVPSLSFLPRNNSMFDLWQDKGLTSNYCSEVGRGWG